MIDYAAHRTRLMARVAKVRADRQPVLLREQTTCQHEWKTFRQTISVDNLHCTSPDPHFIVKACVKCHLKRTIDYRAA